MIAEAAPRPGPLAVWWMGARPRTLVAAVVPVLVGASWAGRNAVSIPRSLLALLVAVALQIGVNYANDYFDGVGGVDTAARMGPRRLVASGLAPPRAVAAAAIVMVGHRGRCRYRRSRCSRRRGSSPSGLLSVLALALYSGGPKPYAASGLGEISVFVFFGLVATCGTAFVQQDRLDWGVLWLAVPVGLLACALLMVNNLRDIPTDSAVGKRTLAVRIGAQSSRTLLVAVVVIALVLPSIGAVVRSLPWLVRDHVDHGPAGRRSVARASAPPRAARSSRRSSASRGCNCCSASCLQERCSRREALPFTHRAASPGDGRDHTNRLSARGAGGLG